MDFMTVVRALADRITAWVVIALGLLALLLGYLGVKDTAYVVEQLPYVISGGLLGLFLLGLGAVLLLSADLRDQWRALLDIRDEIGAANAAGLVPPLRPVLEMSPHIENVAPTDGDVVESVPARPARPRRTHSATDAGPRR